MHCFQPEKHLPVCQQLVAQLENNSRFILGVSDTDEVLTHQQYMKIKCGGIQGMHRVLNRNHEELPAVTDITDQIIERYGALSKFPYNEIVRDIASFSHRKSAKKQ